MQLHCKYPKKLRKYWFLPSLVVLSQATMRVRGKDMPVSLHLASTSSMVLARTVHCMLLSFCLSVSITQNPSRYPKAIVPVTCNWGLQHCCRSADEAWAGR